uniref:Uncharacterized protein n=1 Tax=Psilocybe cubensis TaxID=181762 RepID=A0A8H8CES1_PSICU
MGEDEVYDSKTMAPVLPFETIDIILEYACAICDPPTLSSVALASHLFRIYANKARFFSLVPCRDIHIQRATSRIHTLADIIRSGLSFPSLPGINRFAVSFSLSMTGNYEYVMPALQDGTLAYVLDQLFREDLPYSISSKAITGHSISLNIRRWFRNKLGTENDYPTDDSNSSLDFRKMDCVLLQSLKNLILIPTLRCVTLKSTINVPEDLFSGSRIQHLHLRNFAPDTHTVSQGDPEMSSPSLSIPLISLDIDDSVLLDGQGEIIEPDNIKISIISSGNLACLTRFTIQIDRFGTLTWLPKILSLMPALQELALQTRFQHGELMFCGLVTLTRKIPDVIVESANEHFSIPFSQLGKLRSISITSSSGSTTNLTTRSISHDIPSHVNELAIIFNMFYTSMPSRDTIREVLDEMRLDVLDHHFVHPSFDAIESLTVRLKVKISGDFDHSFRAALHPVDNSPWGEYMACQLQQMRQKYGSRLKVFVTTEATEHVPL